MTAPRRLPRATPESQGLSSAALLDLVERFDADLDEPHSLMVLRHGRVIAEGWWHPCAAELPHLLFSLTKSFTSTAVGLAIADGQFSLDDPVVSFFPDDLPVSVSDNLAAMRVRHLLAMVTGHAEDSMPHLERAADGNWPRAFLAQPVEHAPGTHFLYDTGASHILAAIVRLRTGQKLADYLRPRLLEPLGFDEWQWDEDPQGTSIGGFGLSARTEDIAAFGQLYLQRGELNGRQLVPLDWLEQATTKQSDNGMDPNSDWSQGYCYQFWRSRHGYRGDGAFGQYCVVLPEYDAVVAITSGLADMQPPLDLLWRHLLPGFAGGPLAEDPEAQSRLTHRLATLAHDPPAGSAAAPAREVANARTYVLEPNQLALETARFDFTAEGAVLTATDGRGSHTIEFGHGCWLPSRTTLFERPADVAAAGAWTAADVYLGIARAYRTPFTGRYEARFDGDRVRLTTKTNVGFGSVEPVLLEGKAR